MLRFWNLFIEPLLLACKPAHIVEIGAQAGGNTRNILQFCAAHGGHATIIDPLPIGNREEIAELLANHGTHEMGLSLDVLPQLDVADAYLIDGDHNYYTVYREIEAIIEKALAGKKKPLPILMFHDVGWPYGRRDMYYSPDNVPSEGVLPHAQKGIKPGHSALLDDGGMNAHLDNALEEGTPKNGVFTAIEDCAERYRADYDLYRVPGWHGLGLLAPKKGLPETAKALIDERFDLHGFYRDFAKALERSRCDTLFEKEQKNHALREAETTLGRELRAREREVEAREQALARREHELERFHTYFSQLHTAAQHMLSSNRWRIGNTIGGIIAKLTGRGQDLPFLNVMRELQMKVDESEYSQRLATRQQAEADGMAMDRQYSYSGLNFARERLSGKEPVTIIIPVYNAPEATRRCIDSVLEHTHIPYHLHLINDASTDDSVQTLLEEYTHHPHITLTRHESNQGFVKTVNEGMQAAKGDVVLLNSDTQVTHRWLIKLVSAAASDTTVATVTPLSNAAGAFSVPESGKENPIPDALGTDGMAQLVENASQHLYPRTPTGNGFCLYIKRKALDELGLFDAEAFGRGYGEENDFCMRGVLKGWRHIIDDATYIYHERSASFGADKEALIKQNRAILDERYPDYTERVREFLASPEMNTVRERIQTALKTPHAEQTAGKKRILYVLHQGGGGTPYTNMDLMQHVDTNHECFLLTSDAKSLTLWQVGPNRTLTKRGQWALFDRWRAEMTHDRSAQRLYFSILSQVNADVVHIRHLLGFTFDMPEIAKLLGMRVVLSFHDFYFVCPSTHLIDSTTTYCAGNCWRQEGQCHYPRKWLSATMPNLSAFNAQWREEVAHMLSYCDHFITTTEAAREVHQRAYGDLLPDTRFTIIEHGRDFPSHDTLPVPAWTAPKPGDDIRILLPGQLGINKGIHFIEKLKELDTQNRLHFHFLGSGSGALAHLGEVHGAYEREEFAARVAEIQPAFVGIFSIWPETYCHTLSEAWACGIPVLASDIGAIKERVEKTNAGWLLDIQNPEAAYQRILTIADDAQGYARVQQKALDVSLRTTREMADDYLAIYSEVAAA